VIQVATPANGQRDPDLYRLLGVARQATQAEITRAWRRKARAEHPDARPRDAGAPARFRALAEAYETLSDPERRTAYDQSASGHQTRVTAAGACSAAGTAIRVTVLSRTGPPAPSAPAHGAPLRAGPVTVEPPSPPAVPSPARDERARQMLLAALALRHLAQGWNRAW
jgi:hypothetical protein